MTDTVFRTEFERRATEMTLGALTSELAGHRFEASWFWRLLPAGMRRRWWLFRLFDIIARHWPVFGASRGTLVVRMDGIGDMVLFRQALEGRLSILHMLVIHTTWQ